MKRPWRWYTGVAVPAIRSPDPESLPEVAPNVFGKSLVQSLLEQGNKIISARLGGAWIDFHPPHSTSIWGKGKDGRSIPTPTQTGER